MDGTLRSMLAEIQTAALAAADPYPVTLEALDRKDRLLQVEGRTYPLSNRRVFLAGMGKAAVPMARAVETVLGPFLEEGLVVVKHGHSGPLERTAVLEAGHPEPDAAGLEAARKLEAFCEALAPGDLLILLLSGGASALVPAPIPPITLREKQEVTALLIGSGVPIQEINAVRKHLSRLKGGRLLEHTNRAEVVCLVLSDVPGDDLGTIASGPVSPDSTTYPQCLRILERRALMEAVPAAVLDRLQRGAAGCLPETPKPGADCFTRVHQVIVASNRTLLEAAARQARRLGLRPQILSGQTTGEISRLAAAHVGLARAVLEEGRPPAPPCCLISGGEGTLRLRGDGKGGRNQEFVLWCACLSAGWKRRNVIFSSIGTDGTDGPTDAAGAVATPESVSRARALGLEARDFLDRNDSYSFFQALGDLIITGPTQTNVMDLRLVLMGVE